MKKQTIAVRKPKSVRINYGYEGAEAAAFERLKQATGIQSNVELVRFAVRQTMGTYNVRINGDRVGA